MYVPFGLTELLVIGPALVVPLLLAIGLIDLVRRPQPMWKASGENQLLWAGLIVFVALLGPMLYFIIAVPKLNSAAAKAAQDTIGGLNVSH